MKFNIDISNLKNTNDQYRMRQGGFLGYAIFWPDREAKWYRHPKGEYRGRRGRFLFGFNLWSWIVRVSADWRPR